MEAEGEGNNAMDIYASASNVITASSSDVSMYSSTQTIRGSAGDKNRPTAQLSTMDIDNRPTAQTSNMETDSQANAGTTDFRVQSLFGNDNQLRKRKGFDRISELEEELPIKDRTIYQLKAQIAAESSKITSTHAQVAALRLIVERFQNTSTSQNPKVSMFLPCSSFGLTMKQKYEDLIAEIKVLEAECHELNSQIKSVKECNHQLTQANKDSETSNKHWQAECESLKKRIAAIEDAKKVVEDEKKVVKDEKTVVEKEKTTIQSQLTELSGRYKMLEAEASRLNETKASLMTDLEDM
ncbi:hypothetical protein EV361DRAFT_874651, partial [Lentinula raphanica]